MAQLKWVSLEVEDICLQAQERTWCVVPRDRYEICSWPYHHL